MKTGILINARCGSKRLHDKHLLRINDKCALSYLIERLLTVAPKERIWIATGGTPENLMLGLLASEHKIKIYYGDPDNIPVRHLALARREKLDAIVSIDGDDLLTSPTAAHDAIKQLELGKPLIKTTGLPHGMNVLWAYSIPALEAAMPSNVHPVNDTRWGWVFDGQPVHEIKYSMPPQGQDIRVTLDYPEDLEQFKLIFTTCPPDILADDRKFCEWWLEPVYAQARNEGWGTGNSLGMKND